MIVDEKYRPPAAHAGDAQAAAEIATAAGELLVRVRPVVHVQAHQFPGARRADSDDAHPFIIAPSATARPPATPGRGQPARATRGGAPTVR